MTSDSSRRIFPTMTDEQGHFYVEAEVRDSNIFGKGIFTTRPVKKGTVVCFFSLEGQVITESQFLEAIQAGDKNITRSGTRYVGQYFVHNDKPVLCNYVNHAFDPNLLCHCGICIARRDIPIGEELTVDYRTLIDDTDIGIYNDIKTNQPIKGFSAKETLLRTARELIEILTETPDDWQG